MESNYIDSKYKKEVINRFVPFPLLLPKGKYNYYGTCFCPFHENYDTPSAKLYKSEGDGDTLYCFAEHKLYRPYDLLIKGLSVYTVDYVFDKVYPQIKDRIDINSSEHIKRISNNLWYNDFRENKISFNDYVEKIIKDSIEIKN